MKIFIKTTALLNSLIYFNKLALAIFILNPHVLPELLLIAKCPSLQEASDSSCIHLQYLILTTHSSSYWPRVKIDTLIWRAVPLSIFKPDQSLYLIWVHQEPLALIGLFFSPSISRLDFIELTTIFPREYLLQACFK